MRNEFPIQKFHYIAKGPDSNGNGGPSASDPGWVVIEARTYDDAYSKLPHRDRVIIQKGLFEFRGDEEWDPTNQVGDLIVDSAGWGLPFTLMTDEEFKCLQEDE